MLIRNLLLLFCLINIIHINSIKFHFKEPAHSQKCLGEYLSESTLGKYTLQIS